MCGLFIVSSKEEMIFIYKDQYHSNYIKLNLGRKIIDLKSNIYFDVEERKIVNL